MQGLLLWREACGAQTLGTQVLQQLQLLGSRAQAQELYHTSLVAPGTWDPPGPGIEPASLALAGGFFTTEPPGKPPDTLLSISFGGAWIQRG